MGAELGRISGPLLAANLVRHGIDLAFHNTADTDNILYLSVSDADPANWKIGIKTDAPGRLLDINGTTLTTNLIADTQATIADLKFVNYRIQNDSGSVVIVPDQLLDPTVVTNAVQTDNLDFSNRSITNFVTDSNIELSSNGMGRVMFTTDTVNVNGWLHSTGNITADGSIIIGNSTTDSVDFNADFTSNIIPDAANTYDLGSDPNLPNGKEWRNLFSRNVSASSITSDTLNVYDINLLLTQGNTWYVSVNGDDDYYGNHQHSTFKTVKKALSVAQSGDQVVIFPGTYAEEFPLTVPQGVSINGAGIRAVSIVPTEETNTNDAFLLNGETTVENLAVKDFYYDSTANTGYAFRFAPNVKITSRSPYIRNCTIITAIGAAPAGNGALVDASVADATSNEAAMLFHAVTMIIPNAEGVTATNGARVEWLNSFTYYANRGIHLTEGTLGFASLGVKFGAEMRSINSANVYGTYGAVADGPSTLGYLIGHNFGYVGSGLDSTNDRKLAIQANEVLESNSGKIYFDSVDHKGDMRIGNILYVNQETGQVLFDAQSINFAADGNIVLESAGGITFIDATQVLQTNLKFYGNTIEALAGPVNIEALSGNTYLNTDVYVTGNTAVSADVKISGNLFLGNEPVDTVAFVTDLTQTIKPNANNTFNLGTKTGTPSVWNTLYLNKVNIDNVLEIDTNTISTISGNLDLILDPVGLGKVQISSTDVQVDNNLTTVGNVTIDGLTTLQDYEVTGNIEHVGDYNQTGNVDITGDVNLQNLKISGSSYLEVPYIKLFNNVISSTQPTEEYTIQGVQGSGGLYGVNIPTPPLAADRFNAGDQVKLLNRTTSNWDLFTIDGVYSTGISVLIVLAGTTYPSLNSTHYASTLDKIRAADVDLIFTGQGSAGVIVEQSLKFVNDTISNVAISPTTDTQKSIIFSPNGTGNTVINSTKSIRIPVGNNTNKVLSNLGEMRLNSTSNLYEAYLSATSSASLNNLYDSDRNTYITAELTPGTNDSTLRFGINGTVRATINETSLNTSLVRVDNLDISGNTINNYAVNDDLYLVPTGTGVVNLSGVETKDNTITNTSNNAFVISITGTGFVRFNGTSGIVIPTGTSNERRDFPEVGEVRHNTTVGFMEVWNGSAWIPAVGVLGAAPEYEVLEIMDTWALILG